MGSRVVLAGEAGGVGKSTLAVGIASVWAAAGRSVLVVDLDPRHAATRLLQAEPTTALAAALLAAVFAEVDDDPLAVGDLAHDAVVTETAVDGLMLAAGHPALSQLARLRELDREPPAAFTALRDLLDAWGAEERYDVVVMDTPGRLDVELAVALVAADAVVVPTGMALTDLQSIVNANTFILEAVEQGWLPATSPLQGVDLLVPTRVTEGSVVARQVRERLTDDGWPVGPTVVNRVAIQDASYADLPAPLADPNSQASTELTAVAREVERVLAAKGES